MILDLHVHSKYSIDSPVEPEEYARALVQMQKDFRIDGFVLVEHRAFVTETDYEALGRKYGITILNGTEAETTWGHLLLYGVTPELTRHFPLDVKLDPVPLAREIHGLGGLAVPAHPFRGFVSMGMRAADIPDVKAIEVFNGANSDDENNHARIYAEKLDLAQLGGSDAHFIRELGAALTEFENPVSSMDDLVREIKARRCRPLKLEQARK